jgi:putative DNA primase/helicase
LVTTTNYVPVVNETDHGTWRRLELWKFPYTFRKPGEALQGKSDRAGDPTLKARVEHNTDHQHDAIVTWAVEGAMRWYVDPDTALLPTAKVKADTRAWRAGADRILGFWEDKLIADRDACILTTEMLDAFNSWLKSNGHNEWSKELFGPRFAQHSETARHGVEATRSRQVDGLSRFGFSLGDLPTRPKVYQGVRFQTASDQEKEEGGHSGHTSSETFSYTRNSESFPKGVIGCALRVAALVDENGGSAGDVETHWCGRAR